MSPSPDPADPDRPLPPLFPGRTGAGIRIAVIDSGVHPGHDHIDADRIAPGTAIGADGGIEEGVDVARDYLGHGTAVTAAIQEKAPEAVCIPVRVFERALRTNSRVLAAAIRWSIAQQVDLINLSLGSTNPAHADLFARLVEEASDAGTLIVAAREADGVPCYPGITDGVLPVELDWECPRARFGLAGTPERPILRASGYPRAIPGVPHRRNLYGISFAVAQVTGFAALAGEGLPQSRVTALIDAIREQASENRHPREGGDPYSQRFGGYGSPPSRG
ncbi:S8 family serine peptidase [Sphingomonas sp. MMS24-J13]|uniref:subtilisin-like serine protease QhpE n=1 Tax=Sphingomonas sp. MMS24-J13 TaxID=3238686 RepID=UPI00384FE0B1